MQRLEVSGAVRPIYGSLGVKRLIPKVFSSYSVKSVNPGSRSVFLTPPEKALSLLPEATSTLSISPLFSLCIKTLLAVMLVTVLTELNPLTFFKRHYHISLFYHLLNPKVFSSHSVKSVNFLPGRPTQHSLIRLSDK